MAKAGLRCKTVFSENHIAYTAFKKDASGQPVVEYNEFVVNTINVKETDKLVE